MFFHALTFAGSRGSCLNTRPLGRVFKHRPRDPASVNAMKQTCAIVIDPDFPSVADEIAEPRPDINIKFTVFTVSKKFYYIGKNNRKKCLNICRRRNAGSKLF